MVDAKDVLKVVMLVETKASILVDSMAAWRVDLMVDSKADPTADQTVVQ